MLSYSEPHTQPHVSLQLVTKCVSKLSTTFAKYAVKW